MSLTSAYTYTLFSSPNGDLEDQAYPEVSTFHANPQIGLCMLNA